MVSSFGYKFQYCELSIDVDVELADQFEQSDKRYRIIITSETS